MRASALELSSALLNYGDPVRIHCPGSTRRQVEFLPGLLGGAAFDHVRERVRVHER